MIDKTAEKEASTRSRSFRCVLFLELFEIYGVRGGSLV